MKHIFKKVIVGILMFAMVFTSVPAYTPVMAEEQKEAIILYTNDVHCNINGYSKLAAYATQLENEGHEVIIIDAGDAIQGEVIGSLTEGQAIIDIMNTVGYDYAVPGNHEFDYGMETFLGLTDDMAEFTYLCANFVDYRSGSTVFEAYDIVEVNGENIAIVGISTPESYVKSTPEYFKDENGNLIYGFSQDTLYLTIQVAVDEAIEAGADRVIAVGHLGIEGTTEGWKSTDVIENTTGIDVFVDAHSHEVFSGTVYENKDGEDVLLTSTGTKFEYFGSLILSEDGTEKTELIQPENVDENSSEEAKSAYDYVQDRVDSYNEEIQYLYEKIGDSEVNLSINDSDGNRIVRQQETNMGDFVADAYRTATGADVAIVNSGGIRASVAAGEVNRKSLMDVNPWNNEMCVILATGQQILDALEHGARLLPKESGGFLQVSGMSYEIHSYKESPVIVDELQSFVGIDSTKERRVTNVEIAGTPIDPEKYYTVTGSWYTLKQGGDGFTMFSDCEVIAHEGIASDSEMLIHYLTVNLNGEIAAEQYGNILGAGRITIYNDEQKIPSMDDSNQDETTAVPETTTATPETTTVAPEMTTVSEATTTAQVQKIDNPKGTKIKKLTAAKKAIKVTWKKRKTGIAGYQIQYSTSKKFAKKKSKIIIVKGANKNTKKIKKLKSGKKYYVRIRTYKVVGKKKYYSNWSKAKYKKTKK